MGQPNIQPGSSPLVRYEMEYLPASHLQQIPGGIKALIVLYIHNSESNDFNVMYVGYADDENGNTARAMLSQQQQLNGRLWDHFSVYVLWDHVQKSDGDAITALFKQIYRKDKHTKNHVARNKKTYAGSELFVPHQTFCTFIKSISKTSMQITENGASESTNKSTIRVA